MGNPRKFVNEPGNTIEIEVSKKEIDGVPGILISIVGPTSEIQAHITRREAEALRDELNRVLR